MDKLERFFLKGPGKLDMAIGAIVAIVVFFAYRIGLGVEAKWAYIVLALISVLVLILFSMDKEKFIKMCAIITLVYSVGSLILPGLLNQWFVLVFVGKILSVAFSIFILFFGYILGSFWRWLIWGIIYGVNYIFTDPKRRKLPQTKSIVRKDKWIYLHADYERNQTQLIYRKGRKKRILDTYSWEEEKRCPHYVLEWNGDRGVKVEKYSKNSLKKLEEKTYEI